MNDTKHWLDPRSDATSLERRLLGSARADAASPDQQAALWASLTAGGGTGGAPPAQAPATASPPEGHAPSGEAVVGVAKHATFAALAKPISLILVGAASLAGGLELSSRFTHSRSPSPHLSAVANELPPASSSAQLASPAAIASAEIPASGSDVPASSLSSQAAVRGMRAPHPASGGHAAPSHERARRTAPEASIPEAPEPVPSPAEQASAIREEGRRVAEARDRVRRGDGAGALAALGALRTAFPSGALMQERQALEVEALAETGQRDAARTRALAFVRAYPSSPFLPRVEPFAQ